LVLGYNGLVQNSGPTILFDPDTNIHVNQFWQYSIIAADSNNDPLSYYSQSGPSWVNDNILPGNISTFAGTGTPSYNPLDYGDSAIQANLTTPQDINIWNNNLYFSEDPQGNQIEVIDLESNLFHNYAGQFHNGGNNNFYDSIPAGDAIFDFDHTGFGISREGEIFFSDFQNNRFNKITQVDTLVVNLFNGGFYPGDVIHISQATSLVVDLELDGDSNFIWSSIIGNYIQRWDKNNDTLYTIAGNGTTSTSGDGGNALMAGLGFVGNLTLDDFGNIYLTTR